MEKTFWQIMNIVPNPITRHNNDAIENNILV